MDPGIDNNIYIKLFENHVISLINSIDPDIIITSLGFDAHKDDKYSSINIDFDVYNYIFSYLRSFDKILYILEGGYNKEIIYNGTKLLLKMDRRFYIGFSISSFQTEGYYDNQDWYYFIKKGKLPEIDNANELWIKYENLIPILKDLYVNSFRFSIDWARIYPEMGKVNYSNLKDM